MNKILNASLDMINLLYIDGNYKEALNGLLLIKKLKIFENDDEYNKLINNLINCCINQLKKN